MTSCDVTIVYIKSWLYYVFYGYDSTQPEQNRHQENIYNLNREITNDEISKAIKHTGKSVDPCNFHPTMFQHMRQRAKNTLKKLFNICLTTCTWVWEAAEVIFLRKSGKDS